MPQFIKIRGAYFNNPALPVLTDLGEAVAALPGLAGWVNANENNYYTDGSGYLTLRDLSTAGIDFNRGPGNSRDATIVPNGLNGYPVLRFSGASGDRDGFKRSVSDLPVGASAEFTFAVVAKVTDVSGNRNVMATAATSTGAAIYTVSGGGSGRMGIVGGTAETDLNNGGWNILIGSITGGRTTKMLDALGLSSVTTGVGSADNADATLYLGQNSAGTGFMVGDIAEAIYTTSDLLSPSNSTNLANLINYFRTKYAL